MIYRLRDNLGEPQELGFGLDLKGFQTTVQFTDMQVSVFFYSQFWNIAIWFLQVHSLKPSGATDMQFLYQVMLHLKIARFTPMWKSDFTIPFFKKFQSMYNVWPPRTASFVGLVMPLDAVLRLVSKNPRGSFSLCWEPSMCINCSSLGVRSHTYHELFGG